MPSGDHFRSMLGDKAAASVDDGLKKRPMALRIGAIETTGRYDNTGVGAAAVLGLSRPRRRKSPLMGRAVDPLGPPREHRDAGSGQFTPHSVREVPRGLSRMARANHGNAWNVA